MKRKLNKDAIPFELESKHKIFNAKYNRKKFRASMNLKIA